LTFPLPPFLNVLNCSPFVDGCRQKKKAEGVEGKTGLRDFSFEISKAEKKTNKTKQQQYFSKERTAYYLQTSQTSKSEKYCNAISVVAASLALDWTV
jgi:hypothetical protein